MDFTIRLHKGEATSLADIRDITISGITILRKDSKYQTPFVVEGNAKKFGYSVETKGTFLKGGGSHSYPRITFKGDYIELRVKNFPRFPAFYQDKSAALSCIRGWGYTNYLNKGFPVWEKYRKLEIIL